MTNPMDLSAISAISQLSGASVPSVMKTLSAAKSVRSAYQKYGEPGKRAARTIYGAYKKYKASKSYTSRVSQVGNPVDTDNAKRAVGSLVGALDSRTLQSLNMVALDKTTTNEIDKRQRDLVRFIGTKVCIQFRNDLTEPITVNVAVLHPRDQNTVSADKFFRSFGNERSQNFSTALSANELHCLPVNTDRYTVLKHQRMILGDIPASASARYGTNNNNSWKEVSFWIPLKRQLRYPSTGSQPEQGNVFLVWWCDKFLQPAGSTPTPDILSYDVKVYKYFKETFN